MVLKQGIRANWFHRMEHNGVFQRKLRTSGETLRTAVSLVNPPLYSKLKYLDSHEIQTKQGHQRMHPNDLWLLMTLGC